MVEMDIEYLGALRCRAIHGPSGAVLTTDAPTDNQGKGAAFSPTDLLSTSLGVCMMTIMGIRARDAGIDLEGTRIHVVKEMIADPKRRVGKLTLTFDLPSAVDAGERARLEDAARTCPVALSIHPGINLDLSFRWGA